ncbi:hypothetical protein SAMN05421687_11910 [Salimicrobium flavidum]|uniref:Uncharacterized protein n=1 Tax=Salimicrobium flavidum TaxID=570947 RepID=A0A1N7KUA8_9BACI|nr:hypothetical protein SAMN05421687_11910 [Salimicrobium flavidum]
MRTSLFDDMKKSMEEAVAFGEGDQNKGRRKNVAIKALQVLHPMRLSNCVSIYSLPNESSPRF